MKDIFKKIRSISPKKYIYIFAVMVLCITNTIPVRAFSDFYSDSDIQFYDPNACDPNGGSSDDSSASTGGVSTTSSGDYSFTSEQQGWIDTDVNWGPMAGGGDASKTSFVALSSEEAAKTNPNMKPGDIIVLTYKDKTAYAIYGDSAASRSSSSPYPHGFGDGTKYLEVSPHVANTLIGKNDNLPPGVHVSLYPKTAHLLGSSNADQRDQTKINQVGAQLSGGAATGESDSDSNSTASCCPSGDATAAAALTGSNNEAKIWNYFAGKDLSPVQIAGIMGNIQQESTFDPQKVEGGTRSKTPPSSGGWGIIQWTPGTKAKEAADSANIEGPIYELSTQLDLVWGHMQNKPPITAGNFSVSDYKKITNIEDAVNYFHDKIEGSADATMANRNGFAKAIHTKYKDSTSTSTNPADSQSSMTCSCQDPTATSSQASTPPTSSSTGSSAAQNVDEALKDAAKTTSYDVSITVESIDGSTKGSYHGDKQRPTRSSYKLYVAYATLRSIEAGSLRWSTRLGTLSYLGGTGSGNVENQMKQMIIQSNNGAARNLAEKFYGSQGPSKLTTILRNDLNLSSKTEMGSYTSGGSNSESTSDDFVKFLLQLQKKKLPAVDKEANYSRLLDYMKQATTNGSSARGGIAAGVGDGVTVADKPGWGDDATNDVGIVYGNKPYAVAIMTNAPNKFDVIKDIAKKVHEAMGGGAGSNGGCVGSSGNCDSGNAKILCEAKKYMGIYYYYGGGHQGYSAFKNACKDPSNPPNNRPHGRADSNGNSGNPSPCALDCSGLVSVAVSNAFNINYMSTVNGGVMEDPGGGYKWKSISVSSAEAGDIVTRTAHVEVVDHVGGGKVYTVGTRETGTKASAETNPKSSWTKAYRLTGPGLRE